jgi:hypothetical protein
MAQRISWCQLWLALRRRTKNSAPMPAPISTIAAMIGPMTEAPV